MSILAVAQSFAIVVTFTLVWVSIQVAEELRWEAAEDRRAVEEAA